MDLLSKFSNIKISITDKYDEKLLQEIKELQSNYDKNYLGFVDKVEYLSNYKDDSFEKYIDGLKDTFESNSINFVMQIQNLINEFYNIDYRLYTSSSYNNYDFITNKFGKASTTNKYDYLKILEWYSEISGNIDFKELSIKRIKDTIFDKYNKERTLPTSTNGSLTLPNFVYIGSNFVNYFRSGSLTRFDKIPLLENMLKLFYGYDVNLLQYLCFCNTTTNLKKGKTVIDEYGIESITTRTTGNLVIKFKNKEDANKILKYFNLDKLQNE